MKKMYEEFKESFVGDLSKTQSEELAKFASELIRSKGTRNSARTTALLKEAANQIDDVDDFLKTAALTTYLTKYAEDKDSGNNKEMYANMGQAAKFITAGAMVAAGVAPLAMQAYSAYKKRNDYKKSFNEILMEHPNLGGPTTYDQTRRNFNTIKDFAPAFAKNSLVAGNLLQRMHRAGPAMLDIGVIKELTNTQKFVTESHAQGANLFENVEKAVKKVNQAQDVLRPIPPVVTSLYSEQAATAKDRNALLEQLAQRNKLETDLKRQGQGPEIAYFDQAAAQRGQQRK